MMTKLVDLYTFLIEFCTTKLHKISADTLGWLANIALHAATLPSFLALMTGLTDKAPNVDVVLMLWSALCLLFFHYLLLINMIFLMF